jgi:hypothetical protein
VERTGPDSAAFAEEDFLGDRGDVLAVLVEDVAEREPAGPDEVVAREVVKVPPIGQQRAMEPDRVIEADPADQRLGLALVHGSMSSANGVGCKVVRHVGEPALMEKRLVVGN